ncbi:hypothetical protein ABVT39_010922 [Epinephelus coioides]
MDRLFQNKSSTLNSPLVSVHLEARKSATRTTSEPIKKFNINSSPGKLLPVKDLHGETACIKVPLSIKIISNRLPESSSSKGRRGSPPSGPPHIPPPAPNIHIHTARKFVAPELAS